MKKLSYLGLATPGLALAALVFGALSACVSDPAGEDPVPADDETKELRLSVIVPTNSPGNATRAISATEENTISTISVLAFKIDGSNETFDYQVQATAAAGNVAGSATQTFVANLQIQPYQQRFVVITNAASLVGAQTSGITRGTPKATVLANLRFDYASNQDRWTANASYNYTEFPMWGESGAETITLSTRQLVSQVYLMRMVAGIDVRLDPSVSGLTGKFKMKSVALYNTNSGGRMAPDAGNVASEQRNGTQYYYVTAPTIPTELQPYSARKLGPINYTDFTSPGTTDQAMIGAIYTFEAPAATADAEATCIVVGGLFGSDTAQSYYRVEFYRAGTQTRLPILRNHRYIFNITDVQARGYSTPEAAFAGKPVNMTAQVLVWNRPGLDNIAFDGRNTLATDKYQMTLFSNQYTNALSTGDNVIQATTDVASGWSVSSITDVLTGSPVTWLTVSPTTGAANQTVKVTVSAQENTTGSNRWASVNFTAGRLSNRVLVAQTNQAALSLNIVNSQNQEVQQLVFAAAAGVAPAAQTFTVNWLPATNPVDIVANQVAQYEFPNPGGNPPSNDGAPQSGRIQPGTGTQSYTVSPPALTAAELSANPFVEKASRFDYTVSNGTSSMTKSITLRQLNYALVTEDATRNFIYPLGRAAVSSGSNPGALYNYNVRSNSPWTITNIVETPRISGTPLIATTSANGMSSGDNVLNGASGKVNTTPGGGYREQLTTNQNARGNSGYADVTYTSNPSGRFTPVTKRLFFPSAPFTIYGITGMTFSGGSAAYNIWSNQNNSQWRIQSMVQAAVNYGTTLNTSVTPNTASGGNASTVFVPQINVLGYANDSSSSIAVQQITDAVNAGADMLIISGSTTWGSDVSRAIFDNFLAKQKPVLITVEDANSFISLWQIFGSGTIWNSTSAMNGSAPVYWFLNYNGSDPILNGPFGQLDSKYWGCDGNGSIAYWFSDRSQVIKYSDATNQSGSTDSPPANLTSASGTTMAEGYTCFRFTNYPLIFAADGGFMGAFDSSTSTSAPALIASSTYKPIDKSNYGGDSNNRKTVSNSTFLANVIAWAIQRRTNQ